MTTKKECETEILNDAAADGEARFPDDAALVNVIRAVRGDPMLNAVAIVESPVTCLAGLAMCAAEVSLDADMIATANESRRAVQQRKDEITRHTENALGWYERLRATATVGPAGDAFSPDLRKAARLLVSWIDDSRQRSGMTRVGRAWGG